ncbi:MAG: divergent PAP2 family protein [Filifactor alocis]|nr:divergent PAP2 family protein [Filifactor alocis]
MNGISAIVQNKVLMVSILCWFVAQCLKVIFTMIQYKKFDFSRFVGSGGMPSSHSSFVVGLANSIGLVEGYQSTFFALALVFALVVMYDAAGVRQSVGKQATILNQIFEILKNHGGSGKEYEKLKELVGHTPLEVFFGALLGIVLSYVII